MMKKPILQQLSALLVALTSSSPGYDVPGFTPDQVIEYKQTQDSGGGAVGLDLHVFLPDGHQASDSRPAIVFFFGGGWNSGSPSQFHPHCEYLADRGMVAISAEYRVANAHGTTPQECVKDGKSAVRWIRENAATLGVDPNRIAAGGGSAGGHVAAATGTLTNYEEPGENLAISSKPDALVLFNPVYDNGPGGYGHDRVQAYWEDFSPLNNISSAMPPAVVFLGTDDSLIPVATAESFKSQMETAGVRSDLHLYDEEPHGFFNFEVPDDDSGPWYAYQSTLFTTDEFLVSLGYLAPPHPPSEPVTDWVTIFGDAGLSGGSEATASPVMTDADADCIAANFPAVDLADGQFIRLNGAVTLDVPLTGKNFRFGLFDGDNPVTPGDGTGYPGVWLEVPSTLEAKIAEGDGTGSSHPFETPSSITLGPMPPADLTLPASTPLEFSLVMARQGSALDVSVVVTDGGSYHVSQNLVNETVSNFRFDSVAFLMTGNLNGTGANFSEIGITSGPALPSGSLPPPSVITYVDAVEGAAGNTYATGLAPSNTSWINPASDSGSDDDQWKIRTFGNEATVFQALHSGSSIPELTTEITGLADGTYDVWVFFWDGPNSNAWTISAGLESGALSTYSFDGPGDTSAPVTAGSLSFTNEPPPMTTEDPRILYAVKLGQETVSGGSAIQVFVDNEAGGGSNNRTWYDGVGYALAEPPPPTFGPRVSGVDFNRNDAFGSPSQSMFRVIAGSSSQGSNGTSYSKMIGGMQVTVTQPDGTNFEFRGANTDGSRAIPGGDTSMAYLVSDFIATREGAIDLEITGLPAGDYLFRSFHLDPFTGTALGFAQGATDTTPNHIEASIDGVIKGSVQPTGLGSPGLNTTFISDAQIPTLLFPFTHDGVSPLTIELRSTIPNGVSNFLLLNGFELFQNASP